ncbi:MAG: 3-hydroxyacyl-CoA dehydrogenase NAD-binding domain-containing protein [Alphaproteobacteria bacterium]
MAQVRTQAKTQTSQRFNHIAVIGAGVMGAAIAAIFANAGCKVMLFDIVPKDATDDQPARNHIAAAAIKAMLKREPAAFTHPRRAKLVTPCNLEDDLEHFNQCDLIIEAIIEDAAIKQALYAKIAPFLKDDAIISSNTSTIPMATLTAKMDDQLRQRFIITHFFNPPRYMALLEMVIPQAFDANRLDALRNFFDYKLGKSVILCKDRPGFIGNRLGIYWIMTALQMAVDQGMICEDADAMLSKPFGIPKTGVFGLMDLVGLDLMPHIIASMRDALDADDPLIQDYKMPLIVDQMLAQGLVGRKGKGGFYALTKDQQGAKQKQAIDLETGIYRAKQKSRLESANLKPQDLSLLFKRSDKGALYAKQTMLRVFHYALLLVGDASDDPSDIDAAMRLGYRWKYGPFELMDMIGSQQLTDMFAAEGLAIPPFLSISAGHDFYRHQDGIAQRLMLDGSSAQKIAYVPIIPKQGILSLAAIKRGQTPLLKNGSAALWDIGDDIACFEFTSPMNSFDPDILALLQKTVKQQPKLGFKALIIYNEGANFSVGMNLGLALFAANIAAWGEIENIVEAGQKAFQMLKYAKFPVIGAPSGMALGGGCEILLHCDKIIAHSELYTGLVETAVGIIPGWGGCAQMLARWQQHPNAPKGPMAAAAKVFQILAMAEVSKSAELARDFLFLRPDDEIVMNRDRLLYTAKLHARAMVEGYQPPAQDELQPAGKSGALALEMAVEGFMRQGIASPHDKEVTQYLAATLTGGEYDPTDVIGEKQILALEATAVNALLRHPKTLARVEHMLETNKPLRN